MKKILEEDQDCERIKIEKKIRNTIGVLYMRDVRTDVGALYLVTDELCGSAHVRGSSMLTSSTG